MQFLTFLTIGFFAGILSGIFGIGGGIVIIPALVMFCSYSQQMASGTSLVALLLPVGFFGVWEYYQSGRITTQNIKFGLIIAVGMLIGTYLGARFAVGLPEITLRKSFAIFLIFVSFKMWFGA